jgi:L-galactose dehydrogenase/L-glyceraldehyde 3-phosphate reductase
MEQRPLGQTGLTVSALGFGCGNVGGLMVRGDPADQRAAVARALDAGITYFDTAPQYGNGRSEENLGRVLRELDAWGRVVVGTKVRLTPEERAEAPAAIRRSVERSLGLLGRDHVDLLQLHNQISPGDERGGLPLNEVRSGVAEGFRQVLAAGLVRHVGLTGLGDARALRLAVGSGSFETIQSYFNTLNPSSGFPGASGGGYDFDGLIDHAAAGGMGVIAIRVMAAGALSGTTERAANASAIGGAALVAGSEFEQDVERARRLTAIARELDLESPVELGVRFVLSKPGVSTALVGYSDLEQLGQAIRWAERGPLPEAAVRRVVQAQTMPIG